MGLGRKIYDKVLEVLPSEFAAYLDLSDSLAWKGWGGPMNGQLKRQQLIRDIFRHVDFDEVIETGTFRGATTEFLSYVSGKPVLSIESEARFYNFAKHRCAGNDKISVELGDSRSFLNKLAARTQKQKSFIYLDAHWEEDVPRHDELKIIYANWNDFLIMIDDFQVPDDLGYGFAEYGGKPLTIEYLPSLPGLTAFFPAFHSSEESGSKRGSLVLASPSLVSSIAPLNGLREHRVL